MFRVLKCFSIIGLALLICCATTKPNTQTTTIQQTQSIRRGFDDCTILNDKYPCVVALHTISSFVGSGVLISPYYILTAGHCIANGDITEVRLFNGKVHCVRELIKHPAYKFGPFVLNDIGIIALDEPILDVQIYPMCENILTMHKFQEVDISGYGGTIKKQNQYGKFLFYGILLHEINSFKILPTQGSVWFGDSGGGSFAYVDGKKQLIGIISSFSALNIDGKRVIIENSFVRVDYYFKWIIQNID